MTDEMIEIYNENEDLIGKKMKSKAHGEGLWHKAVHIWIYTPKKKVLLQLRNKDKDIFPDMWDISAAGHVSLNESPKDTALREVKEELGIRIDKKDLEFYKKVKSSIKSNGLKNSEFIYIFFYRFEGSKKDLNIQKEELQDAKFFSIEKIKENIKKNPKKYTDSGKYWDEIFKEIQNK